ncbi:7964_t:CDS:2, partial [Acaulospora morrowiae]
GKYVIEVAIDLRGVQFTGIHLLAYHDHYHREKLEKMAQNGIRM